MRTWRTGPALAWAMLILILCLSPRTAVPEPGFLSKVHFDKFVHAFLFGVMQVLLLKTVGTKWGHLICGSLVVLFGASIEVLQDIMDIGRNGNFADLLADTIGVILGSAYLLWGMATVSSPQQH